MPIQSPRLVRMSLGCLLMLYLSPFELADSRSMTAHFSDIMHNVSSALQGWRDGGQKKRSYDKVEVRRASGTGERQRRDKRGRREGVMQWRKRRDNKLGECKVWNDEEENTAE